MTLEARPSYFELDPVIGWRDRSMTGLSARDDGSLAVDCVPGQLSPFAAPVSKRLRYPIALAHGKGADALYVLDAGIDRVHVLRLDATGDAAGLETIEGFGGKGRAARRLRGARGLAVLHDGTFAIADTGNDAVKLFTPRPYALVRVWAGRGSRPRQFRSPWKIAADPCGLLYIADRGNGRVQRIRRDGTVLPPIAGLDRPAALALHTDGTLVVLDGSHVLAFAPNETTPSGTYDVPDASCLTLDGRGYLYVGTSTALIYALAPTGPGTYRDVGIGVTGADAQILDLLWTAKTDLVAIVLDRCARRPRLCRLATCGTYVPGGTLTTAALDSGIEACVWHRIELDASVPSGTVIEVATRTRDAEWTPQVWTPLTGDNPDCLVQSAPGQRLELTLRLKSNAVASPVLRAVRVHFPRASYLQYLPAIYQEDDESRLFLDRFLSIFQTTFDGFDRRIDDMWMLFDPASTPAGWYRWLASWMALPINPLWTDAERRAALKRAGDSYRSRGTPAELQTVIKEYSGIDARLVEHFRLRQLLVLPDRPAAAAPSGDRAVNPSTLGGGARLWSRDNYQRLQLGVYSRIGYFRLTGEPEPGIETVAWGANEFTVLFDAEPYGVDDARKKVMQVVEREKPAYTKAYYSPVLPRMRVGVQATLGIDTRIGDVTPLLLGTTGTLGYDSILGCGRADAQLRRQGATLRPQLSVNTRLL
jgi:phage tail-like protein